MAYSTAVRNMRNGSIVLKDGTPSTPKSCTVLCDEGDMSWTEQQDVKEIFCRGTLTDKRKGNDVPCELSVTVKWQQLIQNSTSTGDPIAFYEFVDGLVGVTTLASGGVFCLDWEFTVTDPANGTLTDEKIVFSDVHKDRLECKEGNEYNTLAFSGKSMAERPTITRV